MLEIAAESGGLPRAFLRIGASSVSGQQLGIALALGCQRIVCLAPALTNEILALQHLAEKAGAQFHVIPGPRHLLGLVTAADEILAFADGLFASRAEAIGLLEKEQCVLVQPVEAGLAAGFERIDLNHASGGAMRIPGRLVERLGELPADCEAVSALQRIALQAGIRQTRIPDTAPEGRFWTLVRSDAEAHAIEPQWIRQHSRDGTHTGPSRALAMLAVRSFGPALLHAGSGSRMLLIGAVLCILLALGAGWFGLISLGFSFCAIGWILRECNALLARIETESHPGRIAISSLSAFGWITDGVLVVLLAWAMEPGNSMHFAERLFPPLMLVALLRILAGVHRGRWATWIGDRGLLALLLLGAVAGRIAGEAAHLGALAAAALALVAIGGKSRLTGP